jgi:hypothetical protein
MASSEDNSTYFFNQWQMPLLFPQREMLSYFELVAYLAPAGAAETAIWNFPPFPSGGAIGKVLGSGFPTSLAEADDRFVYSVLNQDRIDFPAYLWGDVAVVFSNSYIRNATLLVPTDTGDFACACNHNFTTTFCKQWNQSSCKRFWFCDWEFAEGGHGLHGAESAGMCAGGEKGTLYEHNCTAWPGQPSGTWLQNDHLLAPYAYWYNETDVAALDRVATLLSRMLVTKGTNVSAAHFDYYYEAELLGRLTFPDAVHFVIADLGKLFGTELGTKVRQWCARWGWALIWSPGIYANPQPPVYPPTNFSGRRRVIDPAALKQSRVGGNVSGSVIAAAEPVFARWWEVAVAARRAGTLPTTADVFGWWDGLVAGAGDFQIEPLFAGDCADSDSCIGTLLRTKECVCYDST